ncbi:hypothetical protein [Pseudogemmobacter faecipullorum]|uniref:Uncharacterized protein n=1 Tax=Pseudogemmobacter faecipullorum TaxID=2755041 RepID=A0ABS8CQY1_9RHOB|nr:hypothetical protein [Pseudogemmobacter faecipullorum]MCB5411783.1 hypothetical protein [Pseudogemmobacter faecipullorum]
MSEDWGQIAEEVTAALAEVGFTATLIRPGAPTGPSYDPQPGTPTTHTVTLMQDTISLGLIDGTAIRASDKLVMMAADGTVPTTADKITLGGKAMTIVRVEPFAPGGVDLFYEVLLRA